MTGDFEWDQKFIVFWAIFWTSGTMIRTDGLSCGFSPILTSRGSRRYSRFVMGTPIPSLAGEKIGAPKKRKLLRTLQDPVKDPARFNWHEVIKVARYYLAVDAMTRPMKVREEKFKYEETDT